MCVCRQVQCLFLRDLHGHTNVLQFFLVMRLKSTEILCTVIMIMQNIFESDRSIKATAVLFTCPVH